MNYRKRENRRNGNKGEMKARKKEKNRKEERRKIGGKK